jgi:hypothetical protein
MLNLAWRMPLSRNAADRRFLRPRLGRPQDLRKRG